jgi:hypothetical protein
MEEVSFYETSIFTIATRCHIREEGIIIATAVKTLQILHIINQLSSVEET